MRQGLIILWWFNTFFLTILLPYYPTCKHEFLLVCRLNYTGGYSDALGIDITVPFFGSFASVEIYLSDFLGYFTDRGYTRDKDIRAAPYDWRLSPGMFTINFSN